MRRLERSGLKKKQGTTQGRADWGGLYRARSPMIFTLFCRGRDSVGGQRGRQQEGTRDHYLKSEKRFYDRPHPLQRNPFQKKRNDDEKIQQKESGGGQGAQ